MSQWKGESVIFVRLSGPKCNIRLDNAAALGGPASPNETKMTKINNHGTGNLRTSANVRSLKRPPPPSCPQNIDTRIRNKRRTNRPAHLSASSGNNFYRVRFEMAFDSRTVLDNLCKEIRTSKYTDRIRPD